MLQKLLKTFDLSPTQIKQFKQLLKLYQDWNSKINLSAIKTKKEIIIKHFYDSLLISQPDILNKQLKLSVADLGTGGGFPLLPLAILYPKNYFWGIDSVQKKINVIENIIAKIELKNIKTIADRIETLGQTQQYREKFDLVTTRAFAKWHTLLELALPFLKINGKLIAYQGPQILDELEKSEKVIALLGGKISKLSYFELPENTGERVLVEIEKTKTTPAKYPRAIGIPSKKPLL